MRIQRFNKVFVFEQPLRHEIKLLFKVVLIPFIDLLYKLLLFFYKSDRKQKKYYAVICAIFKNEAPFLKEWIEYHRIIGIEHFYLYNNFSDDHFSEILDPYLEQGIVTLIEWPIPQGQFSAYENWYENYKDQTKWVSFLDIDEFICPIHEVQIVNWLKKYERFPSVVMYWKMFGTSGNYIHDYNKLVLEQYTISWDKYYSIGKVFFNTHFNIKCFDFGIHHNPKVIIKLGMIILTIPPINEFKYFILGNIHRIGNKTSNDFTIQINHYWSKSYSFYLSKTQKGDVAYKISPKNWNYFLAHEHHNKSIDFKIFRFIVELKAALGAFNKEE
jgi:hypothetical protein